MTQLTVDDIAELIKLSRAHTLNEVVTQAYFPPPVIGVRKPRWDAAAVTKYLKCLQKANKG